LGLVTSVQNEWRRKRRINKTNHERGEWVQLTGRRVEMELKWWVEWDTHVSQQQLNGGGGGTPNFVYHFV